MPEIYLTDREDPIERENVFVKATGWVEAYDTVKPEDRMMARDKADRVHFPPSRVQKLEGKVTHANNPGSDRVRTV